MDFPTDENQPHPQQQQRPQQFMQQPQGSWTPSITAPPFYPAFQQPAYPQQYWAYQQMMFAQAAQQTNDYFAHNMNMFNPFPSGTPPPPQQQHPQQQPKNAQYPGFHPYRRPQRQNSETPSTHTEWRPPYARPDASGSSSSVNSDHSGRSRTNSNQSSNSASRHRSNSASPSPRSTPSPVPPPPHHRNPSSSSASSSSHRPSPTSSTSISSSSPTSPPSTNVPSRVARPSPLSQGSTFSSFSSSGHTTKSERRISRDDTDLAAMISASNASASRSHGSGLGLKGRLKRALAFNPNNALNEESTSDDDDDVSIKASSYAKHQAPKPKLKTPALINSASGKSASSFPSRVSRDGDSRPSISSSVHSQVFPSSPSTPTSSTLTSNVSDDAASTLTSTTGTGPQPKKKSRAASLFNSRFNASTDNISLSSTVSSASVMIRKLGSMGRLARRNSLAGITSLFKDKKKKEEEEPETTDVEASNKKDKKKDKKSKKATAKSTASVPAISHVTVELDRSSSGTGDWSVGDYAQNSMSGLTPAAKLARQHTLKSKAEAARKEKEEQEARDQQAAAAANPSENGNTTTNGHPSGVPTWERNTANGRGSSPVKKGSVRVNEDGTRVLVEHDSEEEDDDEDDYWGPGQQEHRAPQQGWESDDDDVIVNGQTSQPPRPGSASGSDGYDDEDDEDVTIRIGDPQYQQQYDAGQSYTQQQQQWEEEDVEPWATGQNIERNRRPTKGILKNAEDYDQHRFLNDATLPPHPGVPGAPARVRSNSYNSHPEGKNEVGPLARIPSPDPDHIDGLQRHGSHSSGHAKDVKEKRSSVPSLPPLTFDGGHSLLDSPSKSEFDNMPGTPSSVNTVTQQNVHSSPDTATFPVSGTGRPPSAIFNHPNSSAPALSMFASASSPHPLTHRSATAPSKRLAFASNLSVYDTFSASVYDRRSEPATWSRLTPQLAQRIKEELNSYKMEEMEVHAASRMHTQFFV